MSKFSGLVNWFLFGDKIQAKYAFLLIVGGRNRNKKLKNKNSHRIQILCIEYREVEETREKESKDQKKKMI